MHKLTQTAKNAVDQAELYWNRERTVSVSYENYRLQQIVENDLSSVAFRVIAGGRTASTFGVTPDQEGLLDQARNAAAHGGPATFSFAPEAAYPEVAGDDPATGKLTSHDLVALCESVKEGVKRVRPNLALRILATSQTSQLVIETTEGATGESASSSAFISFGAPIQGAGTGVFKSIGSVSPLTTPDDLIAEFDEWYGWTEKASTPPTGRLPVIFSPEASYLYLLPLWAGIEGGAVEKKTSPMLDRIGEQIFSERLSVIDDPLSPGELGSRPFDDEGVPCQRRAIVDNGVLKSYLFDLRTAATLDRTSTGNALKRELLGGGTETMPNPWPISVTVAPGELPYREMIGGIEEGLLISYGMGFHSGNYAQGQFAVQAIGYHIKGGTVVGRLDKTMISGDIYEDFKEIRAVSSERRRAYGMLDATAPYVLVNSLQVAGT